MKGWFHLLFLVAVLAMKRRAPPLGEKSGTALKKPKTEHVLVDLLLLLPLETFDLVLSHALQNNDKSLHALASTCWEFRGHVMHWCIRHIAIYNFRVPDEKANLLTPLVLSVVKEIYNDNDEDEDLKSSVLAYTFLGMATHQNIQKIVGLYKELGLSDQRKNEILQKIFDTAGLPEPFHSADPLIDTAWEMICYGVYRIGFPYLFLAGPKAFPVLSSMIDLFISDHHAKDHDPQPYIQFTQSVMEYFPELWNRKVQIVSDIVTVFQLPGEITTDLYPIFKAVKDLTSNRHMIECSDKREIGKRVLTRTAENGELYLYAMIQSAVNCNHINDPEVYSMQTLALAGNILPYLLKFSDACGAVFGGLAIEELASWNWQMKDLVRAVISNRRPEDTKIALFKGYLKADCLATILFTHQCFLLGSSHYEKQLIGALEMVVNKRASLRNTFNPAHLRHICSLLSTFEPKVQENIEKMIQHILAEEYSVLLATKDTNAILYFKMALEDSHELRRLSIDAIKATPALNAWTGLWDLVGMFPALEKPIKAIMQES